VRDDGRRATNESAAAPAYLAFARTPSFLTGPRFPKIVLLAVRARGVHAERRSVGIPFKNSGWYTGTRGHLIT
jgi:hypothetical protein